MKITDAHIRRITIIGDMKDRNEYLDLLYDKYYSIIRSGLKFLPHHKCDLDHFEIIAERIDFSYTNGNIKPKEIYFFLDKEK
jgi:myosin-crossreactive antigen